MKNILISLLSAFIVALALNVQAASVTFDPPLADFKLAPGETGTTSLTINGFSPGAYTICLSIGSKLDNSNIPAGWLNTAYPLLISSTGGSSSATMDLVITVPADAAPGSYFGILVPEILPRSTETVTGRGTIITIEVTDIQTACTIPPAFSDVAIGPQSIWAPSDRDIEINITGMLTAAEECEVKAGYTIESNNGEILGNITPDEDGSFNEVVTISASRSGQDKFGRLYHGTLFATDADGNQTSLDFFVTVLHDKGKKVGLNK